MIGLDRPWRLWTEPARQAIEPDLPIVTIG
jgi:hypothetical protein